MHEQPNGDHRAYQPTKTPGIYKRGGSKTGSRKPYYVIRFKDHTGKVTQRKAKTMKEARALKSRVEAEVEKGTYIAPSSITFKDYAEEWPERYRGHKMDGLREETREEYRRALKRATEYLSGESGRRTLSSITAENIVDYVDHLFATPYKRETVRGYMAPLKSMFSQAVRERVIPFNPAEGVAIVPKDVQDVDDLDNAPETHEGKSLTMDELNRLLAAVPEEYGLMVRLIAQTGLRIGETLGLQWGDIVKDGGGETRLHIRRSVRGGKIGQVKSKRSRREVPIPASLVRSLAEHRLASRFSVDDDLVFPSETGEPQHASNLYRWLTPATQAAGVEWAAFHSLRHTAASRWLHAGYNHAIVARLLGHSDPAFTMRVYVHVRNDDLPSGDDLDIAQAVGE